MEPLGRRSDVVESATGSRWWVTRTRPLLVVAVALLAIGIVVSTMAAMHFRHQVTQLRERPLIALSSASAVATPAQLASPTPAVNSPPVSATAVASAPPLTLHAFDLDMTRPQVTVFLAAAAADGVSLTDGQLVVTAFVRDAQPGAQYRLTGGDCDAGEVDKIWAQGVADPTGIAYLTGPDWTLPKGDQYFLVIETLPPHATAPSVTGAGLEGVFVLSGPLSPVPPGRQPCA